MAAEIVFPDVEPIWLFERDCLSFRALVDGKPVECIVTAELLFQRFGAKGISGEEAKAAYQEHKAEIQALARSHIEMGWVSPGNQVILTTRATILHVRYSPALQQWSEVFGLVQKAFSILAELIGPTAGEVNVEWDRSEVAASRPVVTLRLSDATVAVSPAFFHPKELLAPSELRLRFARVWERFLQERSRNLLLKSG
jgi:hypothetical protein